MPHLPLPEIFPKKAAAALIFGTTQLLHMFYILLLDDDPDELPLLKDAFEELGIAAKIKWFHDFDELCLHLDERRGTADMLFLDINMPRKTGIECLQHLKAHHTYSGLPVIIYTNTDYRQSIEDCFALGATVFLKKTSSFLQLVHNLQKILAWNLHTALSLPSADRTLLN